MEKEKMNNKDKYKLITPDELERGIAIVLGAAWIVAPIAAVLICKIIEFFQS